ncbi:MAG: hypothetical protein ACOYI6_10145 [Christensenellales bacterium]|jgi:hypothetical protein
MKLYVICRREPYIPGKEYHLPESGLSPHGETYWSDTPLCDKDGRTNLGIADTLTEHIFEQIRLAEYPQMPSRFISTFASTAGYFPVWQSKLNADNCHPVFTIEAPIYYSLDGALLKCLGQDEHGTTFFEPSFARACARLYWAGKSVRDYNEFAEAEVSSEMECLVQYPFTVISILSDEDLLLLLR